MNRAQHVVLLLAGGCGDRMQASHPKQFLSVRGTPLFVYTMKAFERHEEIDAIYVVCVAGWSRFVCRQAVVHGISKFKGTFKGGLTGFASLRSGVDGLIRSGLPGSTVVMVHDVVRPLVSQAVISSGLQVCRTQGCAIAGFASNEAFMVSFDGSQATGMMPREGFFAAQTPYTLTLERLQETFRQADKRNIRVSQSLYTLLAELRAWPLPISRGEWVNFKVTYPADLALFKALLAAGYEGGLSL